MAWYDPWTRAQRLVITVPSGTVAALSYFSVVLSSSSLPTELTANTYGRSDGGDLAFAADLGVGNSLSSIGAQIPCEVVSAVFGGSPSAEIHVQVPSIAATGTLTYIWVLYGNSGQDRTQRQPRPMAAKLYGMKTVRKTTLGCGIYRKHPALGMIPRLTHIIVWLEAPRPKRTAKLEKANHSMGRVLVSTLHLRIAILLVGR